MSQIIEESENLDGARIATVQTKRGERRVNVDAAVIAVAELLFEIEHERKMGWTLAVGWFENRVRMLRMAADV